MNEQTLGSGPRPSLLARAGLLVWLACGLVLLTSAVRAQLSDSTQEPAPAASSELPATLALPALDSLSPGYEPEYELRTGDEVALVFVGGSFCGAHRRPGFPQAVEDAKVRVQEQARSGGWQFRAVAVSLDWRPEDALRFLEGFGRFDEVLAGSNWVGDGALRYVWRDMPGEPVVPQLIVLERRIDAGKSGVQVKRERVLRRILGADAIEEWVASGAPI
ncbi:MAG TPA: hypothetical protein VHG51_02905 [Longimicrobiaceae bacterium]|nr:hypothetical protein [Longimicrobiaceae bacterium]